MISTSATDYTKKKIEDINQYSTGPSSGSYYQNGVADETPKDIVSPEPYKTPTNVSGTNLQAHNEELSRNLGKDPGYTTTAGAEYAKRVTDSLSKPDSSSVNVQNTADTNASRRQYMANLQAGEAIGQSGFGAGTAQADRIRMNAQAGVNSANQAGQNSANEYLRNRTEQNMNRASNLENQQYGRAQTNINQVQGQDLTDYARSEKATDRGIQAAELTYSHGRDAIGDARDTRNFNADQAQVATSNAHWDTTRGDNLTQQGIVNAQWATLNEDNKAQRAFENKVVLDGQSEAAKRGLINSFPEGPAKNTAIAELGKGTPIADVLDKLFNADGSLKIVGETPAALGLKGEMETAGQQAELEGLTPNTQAYIDRQKAIVLAGRAAKATPINDATTAAKTAEIKGKVDTGVPLTDKTEIDTAIKSGIIPPLSLNTIPAGPKNVNAFMAEHPSGQFAVGDTVYTFIRGESPTSSYENVAGTSQPRHTDVAIVRQNDNSAIFYYYNGKMNENPPSGMNPDYSLYKK